MKKFFLLLCLLLCLPTHAIATSCIVPYYSTTPFIPSPIINFSHINYIFHGKIIASEPEIYSSGKRSSRRHNLRFKVITSFKDTKENTTPFKYKKKYITVRGVGRLAQAPIGEEWIIFAQKQGRNVPIAHYNLPIAYNKSSRGLLGMHTCDDTNLPANSRPYSEVSFSEKISLYFLSYIPFFPAYGFSFFFACMISIAAFWLLFRAFYLLLSPIIRKIPFDKIYSKTVNRIPLHFIQPYGAPFIIASLSLVTQITIFILIAQTDFLKKYYGPYAYSEKHNHFIDAFNSVRDSSLYTIFFTLLFLYAMWHFLKKAFALIKNIKSHSLLTVFIVGISYLIASHFLRTHNIILFLPFYIVALWVFFESLNKLKQKPTTTTTEEESPPSG